MRLKYDNQKHGDYMLFRYQDTRCVARDEMTRVEYTCNRK